MRYAAACGLQNWPDDRVSPAATLAGLARASSPEERDLYLGLSVHRSEDGQCL